MADMPERAFTPEDLAAERARVALEWQLPQRSPSDPLQDAYRERSIRWLVVNLGWSRAGAEQYIASQEGACCEACERLSGGGRG